LLKINPLIHVLAIFLKHKNMKYLLFLCLALVASNSLMAQCQNDQTPPLLAPKTNLTVALGGPRCLADLQPAFLLQSYSDNCAPAGSIEVRVRRLGEGSGFPIAPNGASLTLTPADLPGPILAEVWARDTSGNTAYTFVSVQLTNPSGCTFALLPDTLQTALAFDDLTWAMKTVSGTTSDTMYLQSDGKLPLSDGLLAGANQDNEITIWPIKDDDPLNGVSTLDLVKISRHILGIDSLRNMFQYIAADIDRNYLLTAYDGIELRKLILGVYTELPDNASWRFIPTDYAFPPPSNPIAGPIPESVTFDRHRTEPLPDFYAVKIGDISGNAVTSSLTESQPRSRAMLTISDMQLQRGQSVRVPVRLSESGVSHGLQAAFEFDPEQMQITSLAQGAMPDFSADNFFQPEPGLLTLSWVSPGAHSFGTTEPLFYLEIKAAESLVLSNVLRLRQTRLKAEAYLTEDRVVDLGLAFDPLPLPGSDEVLPAYPNPAAGDFYVPVRLAKDKQVRMEVFDERGSLVFFLESNLPAGEHRLRVPEVYPDRSAVLAYRIVTDGASAANGRVVVSPK